MVSQITPRKYVKLFIKKNFFKQTEIKKMRATTEKGAVAKKAIIN